MLLSAVSFLREERKTKATLTLSEARARSLLLLNYLFRLYFASLEYSIDCVTREFSVETFCLSGLIHGMYFVGLTGSS